MVSVIAPLTAVRFSPQAFVFSLGRLLVFHLKVADTFSLGTSFEYARRYDASVAERSLELYHINFWSYIVLLYFA